MKAFLAISCLLLLAGPSVQQEDEADEGSVPFFHCDRLGYECMEGVEGVSCDTEAGACDCADGLAGLQCELNATATARAAGEEECNCTNCLDPERDCSTCIPDFMGPNCDQKREEVECQSGGMKMCFSPLTVGGAAFAGAIYVDGQSEDPDCEFQAEGDKYCRTIKHGQCGTAKEEKDDGGNTVRRFEVYVRHDPLVETYTDYRLDFRCTETASGGGQDVDADPLAHGEERKTKKKTVSSKLAAVEVLYLNAEGEELTEPRVSVGEPLTLRHQLADLSEERVYESLWVRELKVKSEKGAELAIIEDGCLTPRSRSVRARVERVDNSTVDVTFTAFRFPGSKLNRFSISAVGVKNGTESQEPECDGGNSVSRSRRDAHLQAEEEDDGVVYEWLEYDVNVVAPRRYAQHRAAASASPTVRLRDCLHNTSFLVILIVLILLLLLSLAILAVCCVRCAHSRSKSDYKA